MGVVLYDLVHDAETVFGLCIELTYQPEIVSEV